MIVEMIAREIGEGAGGEAHAVEPPLLEPVARRFEREMGDVVAGKIGHDLVQLDRIGRGEVAGHRAAGRDESDRAEARRLVPGPLPDLPQEHA